MSDGCGLGWKVAPRYSLLSTTTRSYTNAILPSTFSMTSGTSGCAPHSLVKSDQEAAKYAVKNYESLSSEMAEGMGEYLHAFARILGCNDAGVEQFGQMMQSNYEQMSNINNGMELIREVRKGISENPVLSATCQAV